MDVHEIATKSNLPIRKIRYVLDHDLVPYLPKVSQGRGTARQFTGFHGFVVAIAATLLDAGLGQQQILRTMKQGGGCQMRRKIGAFWSIYVHRATQMITSRCFKLNNAVAFTISLRDLLQEFSDDAER